MGGSLNRVKEKAPASRPPLALMCRSCKTDKLNCGSTAKLGFDDLLEQPLELHYPNTSPVLPLKEKYTAGASSAQQIPGVHKTIFFLPEQNDSRLAWLMISFRGSARNALFCWIRWRLITVETVSITRMIFTNTWERFQKTTALDKTWLFEKNPGTINGTELLFQKQSPLFATLERVTNLVHESTHWARLIYNHQLWREVNGVCLVPRFLSETMIELPHFASTNLHWIVHALLLVDRLIPNFVWCDSERKLIDGAANCQRPTTLSSPSSQFWDVYWACYSPRHTYEASPV